MDEFVPEGSDFHKELTGDNQDSEVRGRALRKLANMVVDHCQKSLVLSEAERAESGKRMERIRLAEERAYKLHAAQNKAEERMNKPGMVKMLESFKQSLYRNKTFKNDRHVEMLFDTTNDALVRQKALHMVHKKIWDSVDGDAHLQANGQQPVDWQKVWNSKK